MKVDVVGIPYSLELVIDEESFIIDRIWANSGTNNPSYSIPQLFSSFGQPEEILVYLERIDTDKGQLLCPCIFTFPNMELQ